MAVVRTLELDFITELGKSHRLRVQNAKKDLESSEINGAMNSIVTANIFSGSGGELTGKKGARVIVRETTSFNIV